MDYNDTLFSKLPWEITETIFIHSTQLTFNNVISELKQLKPSGITWLRVQQLKHLIVSNFFSTTVKSPKELLNLTLRRTPDMNSLPLDLKHLIEYKAWRMNYNNVLDELVNHNNTYINKWGLHKPGIPTKIMLPSWFLKEQSEALEASYMPIQLDDNNNDIAESKIHLCFNQIYESRSIPFDIEFHDNKVNVTYTISMEDPSGFCKNGFYGALVDHTVGYETITNVQNDLNELRRLHDFYKNLAETEYGYFEINDESHWMISDDYVEIDYIRNNLTHILRQQTT